MKTPIPEPYDITDIPYIAWVPGVGAWSLAILTIVVLAFTAWRRNNPRGPKGDLKIIDTMIAELNQAVGVSESVNVERTSRIARRLVSFISSRNVTELTADELRASIEESTPVNLREIINAVATFEEVGYSPPSPNRDASAREVGARLSSLITDYRNELRAR